MALQTDDCDIRDVYFFMEHGGNGDYYLNLLEYDNAGNCNRINMRVAMSGGSAPPAILLKIAELFREMEAAGLNIHPKQTK